MIDAQATAPQGKSLNQQQIIEALHQGFAGQFARRKILVLIPDHTRSVPLPMLFRMIVDVLHDAKQLDFMVALGTHPPLSEENLNKLVGISTEERRTKFRQIGLLNHDWADPTALSTIGWMESDEIRSIAKESWHPSLPERVEIRLNRVALAYDQIIILGPTFPHEVAGYSGGAKYLFPGISGPEMINATHWLGALAGVVGTIGHKQTPVRAMIDAAASRLDTPVSLAALVMNDHELAGIFLGDLHEAWNAAADLSAQRNVVWVDQPFQRVLSCAPAMYDELWTAAKAMYKLEPVVAMGGEVVIYAPHLDVVSLSHGKYIFKIGYHILPYFLNDWAHYQHIPLGVLAHSTHLRGWGRMENGIEKANVNVTLASMIPAADCARLNLGYLDPATIRLEEWQGKESEGILHVPQAGEMLYSIRSRPPGS